MVERRTGGPRAARGRAPRRRVRRRGSRRAPGAAEVVTTHARVFPPSMSVAIKVKSEVAACVRASCAADCSADGHRSRKGPVAVFPPRRDKTGTRNSGTLPFRGWRVYPSRPASAPAAGCLPVEAEIGGRRHSREHGGQNGGIVT